MSCVFCPDNWDNLDILEEINVERPYGRIALLNPLDPVTVGHILVIHSQHSANAAADPELAASLMERAAQFCSNNRPYANANIITSIGPAATQTVMHTHVHIVPRTEGDGLPLPWTIQHQDDTERMQSALLNGSTLQPGVYVLKEALEL